MGTFIKGQRVKLSEDIFRTFTEKSDEAIVVQTYATKNPTISLRNADKVYELILVDKNDTPYKKYSWYPEVMMTLRVADTTVGLKIIEEYESLN